MDNLKHRLKAIICTMVAILLFQSCRDYSHSPTTIEDAVRQEKRVKIKTVDGATLRFIKVEYSNETYYGISRLKCKSIKVPINISTIENLRIHNKILSIVYGTGIGLSVAVFVGIMTVFEAIDHF